MESSLRTVCNDHQIQKKSSEPFNILNTGIEEEYNQGAHKKFQPKTNLVSVVSLHALHFPKSKTLKLLCRLALLHRKSIVSLSLCPDEVSCCRRCVSSSRRCFPSTISSLQTLFLPTVCVVWVYLPPVKVVSPRRRFQWPLCCGSLSGRSSHR